MQSFFSTHSLGGVIGTLLCASLGEHVKAFVNIEGNLTASDAFFSGKAAKFHDGKTFSDALKNEILEMTDGSESFKRYFASVQFADPKTLWNLGKSGIKFSDSTIAGKEYAQLTCKKIYIYGKSTPEETQQFIKKEKLKTLFLEPFGHWPMVEDPNFYQKILDFLETP